MTQSTEFNSIRISLASPEQVMQWSYGEVTKPETINYRTLRPEKDGLFCERIFGPTKDWECYCGKYKKIRYKGVICDRCGVEVTRAKVRRERMGHIKLAAPVAHIWFAKGTPSRLGLLLDLSPRNLERVLYFAKYIIMSVDEESRNKQIDDLVRQRDEEEERLQKAEDAAVVELRQRLTSAPAKEGLGTPEAADAVERQVQEVRNRFGGALRKVYEEIQTKIDDLESLKARQLLTESEYRELRDKVGDVFKASMGAEAILEILQGVKLDELRESLGNEVRTTTGQRRKKAIKRLRVVESFRKSENKVDWMVMTVLPVLPPELRPMVQLDGGRFATSDLNDLYRRVINRNNRLKRLLDLGAPDIIVRNEKRMLQEAVDALIDNGRHGRAISGSHNHKLKSLSDLLRGKQGRFRQNLLGKRVDYSGRSVIVVGPTLRMDQCGLPKRMALELFKPFVMNRLVMEGLAHNIKSAKRMVERVRPELWDILEDVIKTRPVLLNRAPTLHRLGIQAFQPILVEGSAIQIHPLVCTAFNADFDGDQMAVHVPLSKEAVMEARNVMLSTHNMLSPSSGEPIVSPTLDIVLGCYYLTQLTPGAKGEGMRFSSKEDAMQGYDTELIDLQAEVQMKEPREADGWLKTTAGRLIFSEVLPPELDFRKYNKQMDDKALNDLVADCYALLGNQGTAPIMDALKNMGFHYATRSGTTISITDIKVPAKKAELMDDADRRIAELEEQFQMGLITDDERYRKTVEIWTNTGERMTEAVREAMPGYGGVYVMSVSGAKGNLAQIKQMAGMRGLMSNPHGRIIDLPIKSSFREGLTVLEYFISTHGARKGLTDTALRTADSGYLTRRLIDISQDVIIGIDDCGTPNGFWIEQETDTSLAPPIDKRVIGRIAAAPLANPQTGEIIVERNQEIDEVKGRAIVAAGIKNVYVRSPLTCSCPRGICRLCYGRSMATGQSIMIGEAVGIIAAQSIGEPGTQLTMRTFHTGGVAGESDITTGLPRVEELFEARTPKGMAILAEIDGKVDVDQSHDGRRIRVVSQEEFTEEYPLPEGFAPAVESGDQVEVGDTIAWPPASEGEAGVAEEDNIVAMPIVARVSGRADVYENAIILSWIETDQREYAPPPSAHLVVEHGQTISAGDAITSGPKSPQDILRVMGPEAVQRYLVAEVQAVYRNQGITINDKHIEIIVRQMLRKVRAETSGDTDLLPGELVDRFTFEATNARILAEGGEPATARPELLGVTRASLNTESFLAAASFQETTRVLTEAAVNGLSDPLLGLKENVIIGRLIPARLDGTPEGRKFLGMPEPGQQAASVGVLEGPGRKVEGLSPSFLEEAMPTVIDLGGDNPLLSQESDGENNGDAGTEDPE